MSGPVAPAHLPDAVPGLPQGAYRWIRSDDPEAEVGAPDRGYLREGHGEYQDLGKILFKHNGYRPGPVRGWYVIVCLKPDESYAVGQLRADAATPVQLFEDLIFGSEAEARSRAEQMRGNRPGAIRRTILPSDAPDEAASPLQPGVPTAGR